jgi:hypothetical protein
MRGVGNLVRDQGAAVAALLGPAVDPWLVEVPVDDELMAALEEVSEAHRAVLALEAVVVFDGHPRHPAPFGGKRVASIGVGSFPGRREGRTGKRRPFTKRRGCSR